jgi:hypothetical protein
MPDRALQVRAGGFLLVVGNKITIGPSKIDQMYSTRARCGFYAATMQGEIGQPGVPSQHPGSQDVRIPTPKLVDRPGLTPAGTSGDQTARRRAGLAILIAAWLVVLPAGVWRKVSLALSFLAAYAALIRLSSPGRSRTPTPPACLEDASVSAEPEAEVTPTRIDLSPYVKHEAIYPRVYVDLNGNRLDGSAHYQIVGETDMQAVWWAVSIYNERFDLFPNTERHSFTSLNTLFTDGGRRFVIDIAPEWPEGAANWLPCRLGEPFNLVWKFYVPGTEVLDRPEDLAAPRVVRVGD